MILTGSILGAIALAALLLWSGPLRRSTVWEAMTTPLASIIGSGFLVLGPILMAQFGWLAPPVMAVLCVVAYLFGGAIRYNMRRIEAGEVLAPGLEATSSWALSFAYIVSVAYYLNLFGAFGVSLTAFDSDVGARVLTSAVYLVILSVGWTRGFASLERMEYISVTIKLAIIAGLLVALSAFFWGKAQAGTLVVIPTELSGWAALTLGFGLIVTVQGFETSRYLGDSYDTDTRVKSMKWAQWLSAAIYMIYIVLLAYVFERDDLSFSETAIVDMMGIVAPILPVLLVVAALAAQFSAAVADTSGSGGLMYEMSGRRISPRMGYVLLTLIGLVLTWGADVFQIISYASRAFAVYYALQAAIAALSAGRQGAGPRCIGFALLAALGFAIAVFGHAVEG
ncbi:hypothetical protein [Sulfitobacter sp. HGT1]|uniref:hypothetical protein n=1 Tax=Sulfitobacter sp. HGT1 TaxID=2735435 RepID=UPI001593AF77|nr:hypothetical protein [Sulfitobacter sp. HGT1]